MKFGAASVQGSLTLILLLGLRAVSTAVELSENSTLSAGPQIVKEEQENAVELSENSTLSAGPQIVKEEQENAVELSENSTLSAGPQIVKEEQENGTAEAPTVSNMVRPEVPSWSTDSDQETSSDWESDMEGSGSATEELDPIESTSQGHTWSTVSSSGRLTIGRMWKHWKGYRGDYREEYEVASRCRGDYPVGIGRFNCSHRSEAERNLSNALVT
ncbi:uncharacterized protein LOC132386800 isoform X2 [Hypanus sabinus]|uniref:uncharacterized protein LOC132386800 isoform X2 n=1 Tax=Hypanus sabinus TaxID=79690 RepID=UPI0028C3CDEB|nr:uncharacterized protein LOC132386800 isoform X2 [Hypanus sabinus]